MLLQRNNTPERKFAYTGDRAHNHLVMSPTRSPLSHPGGVKIISRYLPGFISLERKLGIFLPCLDGRRASGAQLDCFARGTDAVLSLNSLTLIHHLVCFSDSREINMPTIPRTNFLNLSGAKGLSLPGKQK